MRRFRAIVESIKEPTDHNVIWRRDDNLFFWEDGYWVPLEQEEPPLSAEDIPYEVEGYDDIKTVLDALNKLLYVAPKITSFTLKQSGIYEKGSVVKQLDFSWSYNKPTIKQQKLNNVPIPPEIRKAATTKDIKSNTTFTLWASDGTNAVTSSTSIQFKEYIYYGVQDSGGTILSKRKINGSKLSVTTNEGQHVWLFIPKSTGFTKIWFETFDSTSDFIQTPTKFHTDTGIDVDGIMYVSKHPNLNSITLTFT